MLVTVAWQMWPILAAERALALRTASPPTAVT